MTVDMREATCLVGLPRDASRGLDEVVGTRRLSGAETLVVAAGVLEALAALHAADLQHRDVRPARIRVEGTPIAAARLEAVALTPHDLLSRDAQAAAWLEVLPYTSPEQAGLLHHDVGPASDLYALGAVLHHCVLGHPPHQGREVRALLRQIATATNLALPETLPAALRGFIDRLLARDPRGRYQTASGALEDVRRMQRDGPDVAFLLGRSDTRATLAEPAFVGRETELGRILDAFDQTMANGGPRVVVLEAGSGMGKSRLLDEAAVRMRQRGALLLHARGKRAETGAPFEMLRQLVSALVEEAAVDPDLAHVVERQVETQGAALRTLLPHREVDVSQTELGVVLAARGVLEAVAALRPTVALLDDCQWGDDATLRMLRETPTDDAGVPLCLVVSYRVDDEAAVDGPRAALLASQPDAVRVSLGPLDREQLWEMLTSMAGRLPATLQAALDDPPSPFSAVELLRGLVESGALVHRDGGWRLEREGEARISQRAAASLVERVQRLPASTADALLGCAVLGRSFDLEAARHAVGQSQEDLLAALHDARRRFLLLVDGGGIRFTFAHDRIRETLLARLADEQRRDIHRRVAEHYASCQRDGDFDVAHHFGEAGEYGRARPYAVAAAAEAHRGRALDVAARYYRLALHGRPADAGDARPLLRGVAEVLQWRGEYAEAEQYWGRLLEVTDDPVERADILGNLGDLCYKTGRAEDGRRRLVEGLGLLGYGVPSAPPAKLVALARQVLIQLQHTLSPARHVGRRPLEEARADRVASSLLEILVQVCVVLNDMATIVWARMLALNVMERYTPGTDLGWAWVHHGNFLVQFAMFGRARRYTDRGLVLLEGSGDRLQLQRALARKAYLEYSVGDLAESAALSARSQAIGERSCDSWEVRASLIYFARALFLKGHAQRAAAMTRRVWTDIRKTGDFYTGYTAFADWARMTGGRATRAFLPKLEEATDTYAQFEIHLGLGFHLLGDGQAARAAEHFERSAELSGGYEPMPQYPPRVCWSATAWRLAAAQLPPGNGRLQALFLQRFRRAARRALKLARLSPVHLPHALREAAIAAADRGRELTARGRFRDSLKLAVENGNWYDFAWTLFERGRVGRALGWADADKNLEDARWAFRRIGMDPTPLEQWRIPVLLEEAPATSVGLADRFLGLIEAGRRIVACLSTEEVLEAARQAAIDLLRPQRCAIVSRASAPDATRSLLVVPIVANGATVASIEAVHDDLEGYFQDEERLIGAWLGAVAGAAIENAMRFQAVNDLTASLRRQSDELRSSRDEKEVMLREIHHRVKNNLQVILSLLNMQSAHADDAAVAAQFLNMANRVSSMAMIHEFVYGTDDLAEIRMGDYLRTLVEHLSIGLGASGIVVECRLDDVVLPIGTAVHCGLILNELVTNALQHAFPGGAGGHVEVSLSGGALRVRDNGVGCDLSASTSLGLTLVRLLARQVGELVFHASEGTDVEVRLR